MATPNREYSAVVTFVAKDGTNIRKGVRYLEFNSEQDLTAWLDSLAHNTTLRHNTIYDLPGPNLMPEDV